MNSLRFVAATFAALSLAGAAGAAFAQAPAGTSAGHYEWRSVPQYGPRAPLTAPQRVWVADGMAQADCPMMRDENAAACRAMMPGKAG